MWFHYNIIRMLSLLYQRLIYLKKKNKLFINNPLIRNEADRRYTFSFFRLKRLSRVIYQAVKRHLARIPKGIPLNPYNCVLNHPWHSRPNWDIASISLCMRVCCSMERYCFNNDFVSVYSTEIIFSNETLITRIFCIF